MEVMVDCSPVASGCHNNALDLVSHSLTPAWSLAGWQLEGDGAHSGCLSGSERLKRHGKCHGCLCVYMCLLIAAFMCTSEDSLWGISSFLPPHGHWGLNCGCQLGRKTLHPLSNPACSLLRLSPACLYTICVFGYLCMQMWTRGCLPWRSCEVRGQSHLPLWDWVSLLFNLCMPG